MLKPRFIFTCSCLFTHSHFSKYSLQRSFLKLILFGSFSKDVMVINYVEQNKNRNILRRKPYCNCPCIHNKIEKDGSKTVRDKPKKNIEKDMSKKSLETENQKKSSEKEIPSLTKCKLDVKRLVLITYYFCNKCNF